MKKIFLSALLLFAVLMSGCYGDEPADTTGDKKPTAVETTKPTDTNKPDDKRDSESSNKRDGESSDKRDGESSDKRDGESSDKRDGESSDKRDGESPTGGSESSDKRESDSDEEKPTGVSQPGPDAPKTPEEDKEPVEPPSSPPEKDKQDPSIFNFADDPMMVGIIAALAVLTIALAWLIYDRRKMKATLNGLNNPTTNTPPQSTTQPVSTPTSTQPIGNPPPSPPPASNNSSQSTIIFTGTPPVRPKPTEKLTVKVGNLQNIGSRKEQQDSFCISNIGNKTVTREKGLMAVVADGMGGLEGGATISRLVTETFLNSYKSQAKFDPPTFLYQTAERAEFEVDSYMKRTGVNGGSTVVAVMIKDSMMDYVSVGDSHIYLLRGTDLTLINREHSFGALLMEKAARGEVDPNEPYVNPKRNALTAYIGIGNFNTVDRNAQPILLEAGDKILLCSDGVYNALGDDALIDALKGDPITAAKRLEQTILDQAIPSQDNFTAIILECVKA